MKDGTARVLAIIGLIFMGVFIGSLLATCVDSTLLYGGIGYFSLGAGAFTLMIFLALRADGRGYSVVKMKNDKEMDEIMTALEKQQKEENERIQAEAEEKEKAEAGAEAIDGETKSDAPKSADGNRAETEQTEE